MVKVKAGAWLEHGALVVVSGSGGIKVGLGLRQGQDMLSVLVEASSVVSRLAWDRVRLGAWLGLEHVALVVVSR